MLTCVGVVPLHDLSCVEHVWQGDSKDDPWNVHHLAHHIIVRGLALQTARRCRQAPEYESGNPAMASADGPPPPVARHPTSHCSGLQANIQLVHMLPGIRQTCSAGLRRPGRKPGLL